MELVERYISAVQRYLPAEKRNDIGRELRAHLLDQLDNECQELGRKLTDDEVAATLQHWGHPRHVAMTYVQPTPLVSSELMPVFKQTLLYVLGLIFVLQCLGSSMALLQADYFKVVQFVFQLIFGFMDTAATAFLVVTLVFYAYSASGSDQRWLLEQRWRVQDLPPVSRPWQQMHFTDLLTEVATSAFLLLLLWPSWWMSDETLATTRVILSPELQPWVPGVSVFVGGALILNIWWMIRPYWTPLSLSLNVLLNLVFCALFLALWSWSTVLVGTETPLPKLLTIEDLNRVVRGIGLFAGLYCLYEVARDLYRLRQLTLQT